MGRGLQKGRTERLLPEGKTKIKGCPQVQQGSAEESRRSSEIRFASNPFPQTIDESHVTDVYKLLRLKTFAMTYEDK